MPITVNRYATDSTNFREINVSCDDANIKLGEVQVTPTANTILGRLKDIADSLGSGGSLGDITKWGGTPLTGADITLLLQNVDITLSALRDALRGVSSKTLTDLDAYLSTIDADTGSIDTKIGEVQATPTVNTILGRLKNIADNIGGGSITINDRTSSVVTLANNVSIFTGVTSSELIKFSRFTLFLKAAGAVNITVQLSPDNITWYTIPDGTINFTVAGDNIIEFGYSMKYLKITGSTSALVTAQYYAIV